MLLAYGLLAYRGDETVIASVSIVFHSKREQRNMKVPSWRMHFLASSALCFAVMTCRPAAADPATDSPVGPNDSQTESIVVKGETARGNSALTTTTDARSTTQVAVISAAQLLATGKTSVMEALAQISPAVNGPPNGGLGVAAFTQTLQLRGLSADQTLILVNGHRRHVGSLFNSLAGPSWGTEPTDLALIPISSIDHIEVITEGATSIYGQDAIAGAINIVLKDKTQGGSVTLQNSGFYQGDGQGVDGYGDYAMPLGHNGGSLDLAVQIENHLATNDSGLYNHPTFYPLPDGGVDPRTYILGDNVQRALGIPRVSLETIGDNLLYPLSNDWELYNNSTYGHRDVHAGSAYRAESDPITVVAIHPEGMQPYITLDQNDFQVNNGIKGSFLGFATDIYANYGRDDEAYGTIDSDSPSFGLKSKTNFYDGSAIASDLNAGIRLSRLFHVGFLPKPVSVAFGSEYRYDTFQMTEGEYQSWANGGVPILVGPDAGGKTVPGAGDHPGDPPLAVSNHGRDVMDNYLNMVAFLTKEWEWTAGGRLADYGGLATVATGSIGTRYNFTPGFALRGSFNTGYRPPTLGQTSYFYASPYATYSIDTLPSQSVPAKALGAEPLKGESSRDFSIGFDATPNDNLHVTANLYMVRISDRLASTTTLGGPAVAKILAAAGLAGVTYASYYANPVNTVTYGGDFGINYIVPATSYGSFVFGAGTNYADNEITSFNKNPPILTKLKLSDFNTYTDEVLLRAAPKYQANVSVDWSMGRWRLFVQEQRFGSSFWLPSPTSAPFKQQSAFITNPELDYKVTPQITLAVGANNVFNHYPTRVPYKITSSNFNLDVYNPWSPYGFSGGMYYVRASLNF